MLEFNPNKRITAEQAIADPYLDDIRLPEQEEFEVPEIYLPMDDEKEEDLDLDEVRNQVIEDIKRLSSDLFDFDNDYEEDTCEDFL